VGSVGNPGKSSVDTNRETGGRRRAICGMHGEMNSVSRSRSRLNRGTVRRERVYKGQQAGTDRGVSSESGARGTPYGEKGPRGHLSLYHLGLREKRTLCAIKSELDCHRARISTRERHKPELGVGLA